MKDIDILVVEGNNRIDSDVFIKAAGATAADNLKNLLIKLEPSLNVEIINPNEDEETKYALENIELCLQSMTAMIASLKANKENMELAAASQFSTATDLADWLVQNLNIPFRTAHEITGKIVKICVDENITLEQMDLEKLKKIDKRINKEIYKALNVRDSVERKISEGGTSPKNVLKQASQWIKRLENGK